MSVRDGLLAFPEALKEPFCESGDLHLRDGTTATAEEIWRFMTEEAPKRFPYAFTTTDAGMRRLPNFVELLGIIKYHYLDFSRRFRSESLKRLGVPVVFIQGGQAVDPYYAANAIPARPGRLSDWACYYAAEGMAHQGRDSKRMDWCHDGSQIVSVDACHQAASHALIRQGVLGVDLLAPVLNLRCSDVSFLVESHRDSDTRIPALFVDFPINHEPGKEWVVDYVAQGVRRLVAKIDELTGRRTTDGDFLAQIRLHNRIRRLGRECVQLWWSAPVPPTYSVYLYWIQNLAYHCEGDPVAALEILQQICAQLKERVEAGLKGNEISEGAVRIFTCGSCYRPNPYHMERAGGVHLGCNDFWSGLWVDVEENGDPYQNYARAILAAPYELPTSERAKWTAQQVRESRADGMIFGHHWGCSFQSAIGQMVADIVQQETGVPAMAMEVDDLGRAESTEQSQTRIEAFIERLTLSSPRSRGESRDVRQSR
jgi:benzoyl-CoA reductase/2-hydroxyglutaryl-CoA dehydratase subunit BcrC/BadD/HgdB